MTISTRSLSLAGKALRGKSLAGKGAVLALATTMLVAVSAPNSAQAASGLSQAKAPVATSVAGERLTDVRARAKKRHVRRHYRRNDAAAAAIFGLAAGAIGTAIAASRRRGCDLRPCRRRDRDRDRGLAPPRLLPAGLLLWRRSLLRTPLLWRPGLLRRLPLQSLLRRHFDEPTPGPDGRRRSFVPARCRLAVTVTRWR